MSKLKYVGKLAFKGLTQPLLVKYTHCQPNGKDTTTVTQHGEKMVLLYRLIGSQEVKLAPGHITSYDQVLLSYSRGMRAGKAMAGRELEVI